MSAVAVVLTACWCTLGAVTAWRHRPLPAQRRPSARPRPQRREVAIVVGGLVIWLLRQAPGGDGLRLEPRRVGRTALVAAAVALLVPVAAPGAAALTWAAPALASRRRRRARARSLQQQLPEVVDLLALVSAAGATVPLALAAVAKRAGEPVGVELHHVLAAAASGRRLADAIGDLPARLGEGARPLAAALVGAERDGAPLGAGLERLAIELRQDRRRRAEAAARTVPVKLLFPLVACILPAFALLTVAPLLAGALSALRP